MFINKLLCNIIMKYLILTTARWLGQ